MNLEVVPNSVQPNHAVIVVLQNRLPLVFKGGASWLSLSCSVLRGSLEVEGNTCRVGTLGSNPSFGSHWP